MNALPCPDTGPDCHGSLFAWPAWVPYLNAVPALPALPARLPGLNALPARLPGFYAVPAWVQGLNVLHAQAGTPAIPLQTCKQYFGNFSDWTFERPRYLSAAVATDGSRVVPGACVCQPWLRRRRHIWHGGFRLGSARVRRLPTRMKSQCILAVVRCGAPVRRS